MENYHRRAKTTKSKFEQDEPSTSATTGPLATVMPQNRPQKHGVMVITPNGKIRTYVTRALEILFEGETTAATAAVPTSSTEGSTTKPQPAATTSTASSTSSSSSVTTAAPTNKIPTTTTTTAHKSPLGVLTLKAQGKSTTKAVTVAEILKRRCEGTLHQFTEIGLVTEQEVWDPNPDHPHLDPLIVSRNRPTIRIRLSKDIHLADDNSNNLTHHHQANTLSGDALLPGSGSNRVGKSTTGGSDLESSAEEEEEEEEDDEEPWPGAILERDAAARRFVGYQAPTGNDIYL